MRYITRLTPYETNDSGLGTFKTYVQVENDNGGYNNYTVFEVKLAKNDANANVNRDDYTSHKDYLNAVKKFIKEDVVRNLAYEIIDVENDIYIYNGHILIEVETDDNYITSGNDWNNQGELWSSIYEDLVLESYDIINGDCNNITVRANFNTGVSELISPIQEQYNNQQTTIDFELERGIGKVIITAITFFQQLSEFVIDVPPKIESLNFEINDYIIKDNHYIGIVGGHRLLALKYSINGASYDYNKNVIIGEYSLNEIINLKVKDQFNCELEFNHRIKSVQNKILYASEDNHIRFIKPKTTYEFKNDSNSLIKDALNGEEMIGVENLEITSVQTANTLQVLSNYNKVAVRDISNGFDLDMDLKQERVGLNIIIDSKLKRLDEFNLEAVVYGLFLDGGNIYEEDEHSMTVIGTYRKEEYKKYMDIFFKNNQTINIEEQVSGVDYNHMINKLYFSEKYNQYCVLVYSEHEDLELNSIIRATYNLADTNVFERLIPNIAPFETSRIRKFELYGYTTNLTDGEKQLSDPLCYHFLTPPNTITIEYWNNSDSDIIATGIKLHKIVKILSKTVIEELKTDKNITDNSIQTFNQQNLQVVEYVLQAVPYISGNRILRALLYENVLINGQNIKYHSHSETKVNNSNLVELVIRVYMNKKNTSLKPFLINI